MGAIKFARDAMRERAMRRNRTHHCDTDTSASTENILFALFSVRHTCVLTLGFSGRHGCITDRVSLPLAAHPQTNIP